MNDQNLYEILGLTEDATKDEIKRAYFRKIRIHTNEKHPEEFQQLTRAYQTLYDDQKRAEYDRQSQDGGMYAILARQVMEEMGNRNYHYALTLLEDMLAKYPHDPDVRYMTADGYIELGRNHEAKNYATDLVFEDPQSEKYRSLLYIIYRRIDDLYNARQQINRLIEINPLERDYYMQLSSINIESGRYEESVRVLEQGLQVTTTDIADYPLLSELYFITYLNGDMTLRNSALYRIKTLSYSTNKQQLLYLLVKECDETDANHQGLPGLIQLVNEINNGEYGEINDWLSDKRYYLNEGNQSQQTYNQTSATVSNDHQSESGGSSLFSAIVVGIILSMIATPIAGIIGGIVFYNYGAKIMEFIGCLLAIIIALVILSMFF